MAYKYDVFLSYNRKNPHGKWVCDEFYPFFKPFLEDALNIKNARIFIDTKEIEGGQAWEMRIKDALIHSKIMVSILSPAYFLSEWCQKEFAFMDYRQRKCGYLTIENPDGLIVPLKISDGEHFSEYVRSLQIKDFNNYFRIGIGFSQTPLHSEFQGKLQDWVQEVAHAYNNAPEWDDDWKNPDWILKSVDVIDKLYSSITKNQPKL